MKKERRQQGFTLAELLIVVAIIAVLVAIAIPVFSTQLEKSRDSTDQANIRSAYAELSAALVANTKSDASLDDLGLKAEDGWTGGTLSGDGGTITYTFEGQGTNDKWDNKDPYKAGRVQVKAKRKATSIAFTVDAGEITNIVLN